MGKLLNQLRKHPVQIIVSDGLSTDDSVKQAVLAGAQIAIGHPGRGQQLRRAVSLATDSDWYLFIHADSELPDNWYELVQHHIESFPSKAGFFNLKFASKKWAARWVELMVAWRCMKFPFGWALPYGDQGLLISRHLYDQTGGYPDWSIFEDVKLIEKIGGSRLRSLKAKIKTSAAKYERDGFLKRGWRNFSLLRRYKAGAKIEHLLDSYQ